MAQIIKEVPMKYAVWVLTNINEGAFQSHEFTCSNCKNTMFGQNYLTEDGRTYDLSRTIKQVLVESPYCCKCGSKMKQDQQLKKKENQYQKSCKAYREYAKHWYIGEPVTKKLRWEVDEIVTKSEEEIPF
jgi:hypothetical protein